MATFTKLPSGNWRGQVRRKGRYAAETFRRKKDAESWALEIERRFDRGEELVAKRPAVARTFGDLIDIHVNDMIEVGKAPRRSKAYSLDMLRTRLGRVGLRQITREKLIEFGRKRAKEGAGPVTLAADLSYVGTIVTHAAAIHGIDVTKEPVDLARIALRRLGLIGRSNERERRPTRHELDAIMGYVEGNSRQLIPVGRIVRFAVATAMRQEEICRIEWRDVDPRTRTVIVRDRKDPRYKSGNDQKVPLLEVTGFDAWTLIEDQRTDTRGTGRIFPYNARSVGAAFRRACRALDIADLHFHDLRHEATSRLFEAGLKIEQVALVTGHRDWKMLQRYTNLRPENLHQILRTEAN
jgi:integrase